MFNITPLKKITGLRNISFHVPEAFTGAAPRAGEKLVKRSPRIVLEIILPEMFNPLASTNNAPITPACEVLCNNRSDDENTSEEVVHTHL